MFTESPDPGTPAGVQSAPFDQLSDPSFQSLVTASPFPATSNKQTTASPTIKVRHMTTPSRRRGNKDTMIPSSTPNSSNKTAQNLTPPPRFARNNIESRDRRSRNSCPTRKGWHRLSAAQRPPPL